MHIYTVTVTSLYIYKGLERLMKVFFLVILCKFLHFLYFVMTDAIALKFPNQ